MPNRNPRPTKKPTQWWIVYGAIVGQLSALDRNPTHEQLKRAKEIADEAYGCAHEDHKD